MKTTLRLLTLLLLAATFSAPGAAAEEGRTAPVLLPGEIVFDGTVPLSIGHTASVEVADWNSDGKLDIVYGVTSYKDSKCRVYVFLRP